jgi:peptide deformylase
MAASKGRAEVGTSTDRLTVCQSCHPPLGLVLLSTIAVQLRKSCQPFRVLGIWHRSLVLCDFRLHTASGAGSCHEFAGERHLLFLGLDRGDPLGAVAVLKPTGCRRKLGIFRGILRPIGDRLGGGAKFCQQWAMPIRKIAQLGEPVLRRQARALGLEELATPEIQRLLNDMIATMRDADGAGLAAPQVYESLQLVVIELQSNPRYPNLDTTPLTVLVNPKLTPLVELSSGSPAPEDAIQVYEGCLSVTGLRGRVTRPRRVRVEALDATGRALDLVWEGFAAAVVQHEVDHLAGILYVDRADPKSLMFLREFERHVPAERRVLDGAMARESRAGVTTDLAGLDG